MPQEPPLTPDHPTSEILDRFQRASATPAECRWVLGHLIAACASCTAYLRRSLKTDPADDPDRYDQLLATAENRASPAVAALRQEALAVTALFTTLEGTPPAHRLRKVTSDPRYRTVGLASRYLDFAAELQATDLPRALAACELAIAIAGHLPVARYPAVLAADLQAHAWSLKADTLRLDDDLPGARGALRRAWCARAEGSGDPLLGAALLRVQADMALAKGDSATGASLLHGAADLYHRLRDDQLEGHTLVKLARTVGYDDPAQGASLARRALDILEPGRDPALDLTARHLLVWFLADSGRAHAALDELQRARPLYKTCPPDAEPLRLRTWLEARLCRRLGELAAAERGFARAWHDFAIDGFPRDLTLVSLDLAEAYWLQGKSRHAIRLLKAVHALLLRLDLHSEGLAAWLALVDAAATDTHQALHLTPALATYFRRAWLHAAPFVPIA